MLEWLAFSLRYQQCFRASAATAVAELHWGSFFSRSLVERKHPVAEGEPECTDAGDGPEAAVVLRAPFPHVLVRPVAERRIRRQLAVAQFIVARLRDVEGDGAAPGEDPLALPVAHRVNLAMAAAAPVVRLAA